MVIKFKAVEPRADGVISYPVKEHQNIVKHVACRLTTPDNPFRPHEHEGDELWYIIKGEAVVNIGGKLTEVEDNDLIVCPSVVSHGMTSNGEVYWLCIG
jgi:mannose-6-phosphate isomerase-like protein (cupin superfamily)